MPQSLSTWPSTDGLRIGHLNINSALNKMTDISSILDNNGKPFHVFAFTESRLSSAIPDSDVNIPGFQTIRKDSTVPNTTGLLVYVHDTLTYKRLAHLENFSVESIWLEIKLKRSNPIRMSFLYRNPLEKVEWMEKFSSLMDAASLDASEIILLGDFNIDLLKPQTSWLDITSSYNLVQLVNSPTRITASSKTIIDHIYTTHEQNIRELCVPVFGCSDHLPVCLTWSKRGTKVPKTGHKYCTYRSYSKFNKEQFLFDLSHSNLYNVYNFTDPDKALEYWLHAFNSVYDKHAPFKTQRIKHISKPKWFTKEIQDAIWLRDKLLKAGKHQEYKKQRNKVNSLKRTAKKQYFEELVSSKQNSKAVWSAINQLTNKSAPKQSCPIRHISPDNINLHFTTIADKVIKTNCTNENNLRELRTFCNSKNIISTLVIPPMTITEVYQALCHLKQSGTRGLDGIDGKILKLSAPVIAETLTYVYNLCIDKSLFPIQLKQARVIPIFKSGDPSQPSNYRPISILPALSKPLEKHINKHLSKHLETYDLLHINQSGFRQNHSCQTALINLVDQWLHNINEDKFSGALFVDFAKAFDVIDHDLLYRKLLLYGVSDQCHQLITSFLTNRNQVVCIDRSKSIMQEIKYGVPQGSVLGPILFSIYVNDLPLHIPDLCELFCDDTTIHTSHHDLPSVFKSLQNCIDKLTKWSHFNHMSLNPHKTKLMVITTRQKRQNITTELPTLCIAEEPVEIVDSHRVLGVMIDNNLSWHSHVNYMCKTLSKKIYQLCRIKHFLSPHARRLFFHAHILSCISYCSTLFDSASENTTKPLVRIYKRAVKAVLLKSSSLTTSDYEDLDILPLKLTFAKNKAILMQKIALGTVPLALQSKFQRCIRQHGKLQVPIPRLDLFKSSLHYSGSILWNALPQTVKSSNSISVFKTRLKRHFKSIE